MHFEELISRLAPSGARVELTHANRAFRYAEGERPDFVPPELIEPNGRQSGASALLITAPAATGKSTCAEVIANRTNGLILDLSQVRVADGSFLGLLEEAVGEERVNTLRADIKSGQQALLLDALDETNVASGDHSFAAFLVGLCRFLRTAKGAHNLILFSRSQAAEWIRLVFDEENVPLDELELSYFGETASLEFVDLKLDAAYDRRKKQHIHRVHREAFEYARSDIFEQLAKILGKPSASEAWQDEEGRRFIGYSPVLEGISEYLCVDDFRALETSSEKIATDFSEWRFLVMLLEKLLGREQAKFLTSWLDQITRPMFSEPELGAVFAPTEQCVKLVQGLELSGDVRLHNAIVPESLQTSYAEAVVSQIGDHPFSNEGKGFVSPIFRDFAVAVSIMRSDDDSVSRRIVRKLSESPAQGFPALGPFLLVLSALDETPVPLSAVQLVMSSLTQGNGQGRGYSFRMEVSEGSGYLLVEDSQSGGTFAVAGNETLHLPHILSDVHVSSDQDVVVRGTSLNLGPRLSLEAVLVELSARECVVNAYQDVRLVGDYVNANWEQSVHVRGQQLSIVASESDGWPQRYRVDPLVRGDDEDFWQRASALRRLIKFFRRSQHTPKGFLSADVEQLNVFVLRTDEWAHSVLQIMRAKGYVTEAGKELQFDQAFFTDAGMNYDDLMQFRVSEQLRSLLSSMA